MKRNTNASSETKLLIRIQDYRRVTRICVQFLQTSNKVHLSLEFVLQNTKPQKWTTFSLS